MGLFCAAVIVGTGLFLSPGCGGSPDSAASCAGSPRANGSSLDAGGASPRGAESRPRSSSFVRQPRDERAGRVHRRGRARDVARGGGWITVMAISNTLAAVPLSRAASGWERSCSGPWPNLGSTYAIGVSTGLCGSASTGCRCWAARDAPAGVPGAELRPPGVVGIDRGERAIRALGCSNPRPLPALRAGGLPVPTCARPRPARSPCPSSSSALPTIVGAVHDRREDALGGSAMYFAVAAAPASGPGWSASSVGTGSLRHGDARRARGRRAASRWSRRHDLPVGGRYEPDWNTPHHVHGRNVSRTSGRARRVPFVGLRVPRQCAPGSSDAGTRAVESPGFAVAAR